MSPADDDAVGAKEPAGDAGDAGNATNASDGSQDAGGRSGSLGGQVRRVLLGGASALFSTEENIRSVLSEVRVPKDAARLLLQQVEKARLDVTGLVAREVKRAVRGADLRGELRRALLGMRIDVRASVRFREDGAPPKVQLTSRVRRRRRKAADAAAAVGAGEAAGAPPPSGSPGSAQQGSGPAAPEHLQPEPGPRD